MTAAPTPPIRVLLVDDHQVVLRGVELSLRQEPDVDVVGAAATEREAIALAETTDFDVALVDMHLPDASGAEVVAGLRRARPNAAVVVLSGDADEELQLAAVEAGAAGYLLKTAGTAAIVSALRRAARHEVLFEPAQLSRLFARRRDLARAAHDRPALTARESEILDLMAVGADTKTMAHQLRIGEHTVRRHTQNILAKLGAHSRLEAVAKARAVGLLRD